MTFSEARGRLPVAASSPIVARVAPVAPSIPPMDSAPIRILLIDDHAVLRAGLANLLSLERDVLVVGEADNGEEGVRLWQRHRPHVTIIDISMAGMDGIETARKIRRLAADARILMLTSSDLAADAARAAEAGAAAYVTKRAAHDEIADVIRRVHAGQKGIRIGVVPAPRQPHPELLSTRELEVLQFMRLGLTNVEIGHRLGIAERTVKSHVTGLFVKLDAHDRAGAVARGFDLGLLRIDPAATRPPSR
jgi:DNA-binding NarL/FixJ family response regulator